MIHNETKIKIADNSGATLAKCIKIVSANNKTTGRVGNMILVSIKKKKHQKKIKKKIIYYGLIIMIAQSSKRKDGSFIKCSENRILIFSLNHKFIASRIYGPIMQELKIQIHKTKIERNVKNCLSPYLSSCLYLSYPLQQNEQIIKRLL
jgi:large subunit ribosomal protein L14